MICSEADMLAVGIVRGQQGIRSFELPLPRIEAPDDVLVRIREVGLDGTDYGIVRHNLQDIAEGRDSMAMGHEMVGVVQEVGTSVKSVVPGDAVTLTVRRGCGICEPCLHNQSDMCMTGLYTERGIHKLDGYLTEYVVDQEQYVVKIAAEAVPLAVFTEPLSIAEKAVEQIKVIQSRLPWTCPHPNHDFSSREWGRCKNALVLGAGPLGLLATALLRLDDVRTWTADILPEDSAKASLVTQTGACYVDARDKSAKELVDFCSLEGTLNMVIEASGAAATALDLVNHLARSSIYVMTGIPREGVLSQVDVAQLIRKIVRENQVIVGSVNSNRRHFEAALSHIGDIESAFDGMLGRMITHRFTLANTRDAFALVDHNHIKTVIEIAS
jgi:threonine dehydrogenase-like Zn-dependent dehydrogenase